LPLTDSLPSLPFVTASGPIVASVTAFFASLLVPTDSLPSLALVTAFLASLELITTPGAEVGG
jgi:hypothetical protein